MVTPVCSLNWYRIAELIQRPLYRFTAGDVSTDPMKVEQVGPTTFCQCTSDPDECSSLRGCFFLRDAGDAVGAVCSLLHYPRINQNSRVVGRRPTSTLKSDLMIIWSVMLSSLVSGLRTVKATMLTLNSPSPTSGILQRYLYLY